MGSRCGWQLFVYGCVRTVIATQNCEKPLENRAVLLAILAAFSSHKMEKLGMCFLNFLCLETLKAFSFSSLLSDT